MKGLLLKDIYTITKQMRVFLIMIVLFALVPGYPLSGFALVYSAMLPVTALAYDERSKWNELAAMMPYTKKDIVSCKYFLGYVSIFCAGALCLSVQLIASLFGGEAVTPESVLPVLIMVGAVLIFQSVNLPFMFRFGVEKGRLIFMALAAAMMLLLVFFGSGIEAFLTGRPENVAFLVCAVCAVSLLLSALSRRVSIYIYGRTVR